MTWHLPKQVKITYTSTNIAHHYRYAREFERLGCLEAFVTGASRWSPRSAIPEMGSKLVRCDFYQNLYLAALRVKAPDVISGRLSGLSNASIDRASLAHAAQSDVFLYYRTTGCRTTRQLRAQGSNILCVLEEVNSHVDHCHDLMKQEYKRLALGAYPAGFPDHNLRQAAYEEADCILCPSSFVKRSFIERGFPEERLLMVNFGFSLPEIPTGGAKTDSVFRLLYVGQLHFRKGLRYAIEAFKRLKHPRKEFVIVGPSTKITGLENLSIPPGVVFAGVLKGKTLAAAYASASAFVLPTIEEGLALVQGEAMAAGLPLITTTHSGGDDLITHGIEGYIVPPGDPTALAEAIQALADDADLCERMGEASRLRAKELGGWDVAARKLVDALQTARDQWMRLREK